jgi:hypothetical protein
MFEMLKHARRAARKAVAGRRGRVIAAVVAAAVAVVPLLGLAAKPVKNDPLPVARRHITVRITEVRNDKAVWSGMQTHFAQADAESLRALEARLARVREYIEDRKGGAPAFAEDMVGVPGKLVAAGASAQGAMKAIVSAFGGTPASGPDFLEQFAADAFTKHVLTARGIEDVMQQARSGYGRDVEAIGNRLLVKLQQDVPDAVLLRSAGISTLPIADKFAGDVDEAVAEAVRLATGDLVVSVSTFALSWIGGDIAQRQLTNEEDGAVKKFGVNVAGGFAVEKSIERALEHGGYDPAKKIAASVARHLDALRDEIVDGRVEMNVLFARAQRARGTETASPYDTILPPPPPSPCLRDSLMKVHAEQSQRRKAVLYRQVFGAESPRTGGSSS